MKASDPWQIKLLICTKDKGYGEDAFFRKKQVIYCFCFLQGFGKRSGI